jgi:hypothetical protein|nr:hypothetical protein Q903MT_gene2005 [Picea sitchensis]
MAAFVGKRQRVRKLSKIPFSYKERDEVLLKYYLRVIWVKHIVKGYLRGSNFEFKEENAREGHLWPYHLELTKDGKTGQ